MGGYAHITRCDELLESDIVVAIDERRSTRALLDRLAKVSRPGEGAPRVLVLLGRVAGRDVDWVDGAMRVEVAVDETEDGGKGGVTIDVLTALGFEMQERVVPSFKMKAPFREFVRLVDAMPHSVEPLVVITKTAKRLVLAVPSESSQRSSVPAPPVVIADDALYRGSAKQRAAKRASRPEFEAEAPTRAKTLRPAEMPAPNSPPHVTPRKKTLRPEVHAVPPQPPHVPRAPRVPFKTKTERGRKVVPPSGEGER
jgi:hypothetical protein